LLGGCRHLRRRYRRRGRSRTRRGARADRGGNRARLELSRRGVTVEEPAEPGLVDGEEEREMLLEHARLVEPAGVDGVVAGVADQPLGDLARLVLRAVEAGRRYALCADLVVQVGEVEVERLRRRAADDRLDLVRKRLELF